MSVNRAFLNVSVVESWGVVEGARKLAYACPVIACVTL